jgi:hypothetical protein
MNLKEPGGLIVLEVESNQYSFNEISKLVETNDAQITQLNTSNDPETGYHADNDQDQPARNI